MSGLWVEGMGCLFTWASHLLDALPAQLADAQPLPLPRPRSRRSSTSGASLAPTLSEKRAL